MLRALLNLALAGLICLVVLGDRASLEQLLTLLPASLEEQPVETVPGELTLKADARGHFLVTAKVNGQPVRFLIDSGASHVVLSAGDAKRLGLTPKDRDFTDIYRTPGGIIRAAPVTLAELRIGELVVRDVRASVSSLNMDVSLLGASFLARLRGYEVNRGRLTLRW
ncbi:MAG: TIGR02281 family clan AA aspartic protease [Rhodospirillales bacterium]